MYFCTYKDNKGNKISKDSVSIRDSINVNNKSMAVKKQNSGRRPKPMVPKAGVKPKAMGGGRYACGGKLSKKKK